MAIHFLQLFASGN